MTERAMAPRSQSLIEYVYMNEKGTEGPDLY